MEILPFWGEISPVGVIFGPFWDDFAEILPPGWLPDGISFPLLGVGILRISWKNVTRVTYGTYTMSCHIMFYSIFFIFLLYFHVLLQF